MRRADLLFNVLRVPVDAAMLVAAGVFTYLLRTQIFDAWRPVAFAFQLPLTKVLALMAVVAPVFLLAFAVSGLYAMRMRITVTHEALRILVASSGATMALISFMFLRAELFNSRFLILGFWLIASLMVIIGRLIFRHIFRHLMARYGVGTQRALLIGDGTAANQLEQAILEDSSHGYQIATRSSVYDIEMIKLIVAQDNINEILFAHPTASAQEAVPLIEWCHQQHIAFRFVPTISQMLTVHHTMDIIGRVPLIELRRTALDGWGRIFKRLFDVIFAFFALILITPIGLLIAFAIQKETNGPIFVRLKRVSGVRQFSLVKFRSMVANAETLKPSLANFNERNDGPLFKMRDDPRITRVGKFIRKFRLDELPQFWNVLVGDISVVGPRPHQPDEVAKYSASHRRVLAMKAGATGLAQISGASDLPFEDEVRLDTLYMENWSLWLDVQIVFRTMWHMLVDRSAV